MNTFVRGLACVNETNIKQEENDMKELKLMYNGGDKAMLYGTGEEIQYFWEYFATCCKVNVLTLDVPDKNKNKMYGLYIRMRGNTPEMWIDYVKESGLNAGYVQVYYMRSSKEVVVNEENVKIMVIKILRFVRSLH